MDIETAVALITDYAEGYEAIEEREIIEHLKHDEYLFYSIYKRESDDTYWKILFASSDSWLDKDSLEIFQVKPEQVVTTKWVKVKSQPDPNQLAQLIPYNVPFEGEER